MNKLLIIEDEIMMLEMYKIRLEMNGYQVLTAKGGRIGLEITKREKPDLIILDIVMPGVTGYDVLRKLKKDSETKMIPVLVFSNLGQEEEIER